MRRPTLDKFPKSALAQIDVQKAFIVSRVVVAAERLQVFRLLDGKRLDADAIGRALHIHKLYLRPFLDALASLGLLRKSGDTHRNSAFAGKYFVRERSIYWTRQFSAECAAGYERLAGLEKTLRSGKPFQPVAGPGKPGYVERMKRDKREARDFTQMLFYLHQDDAAALAARLDLTGRRALLDAGGGSGVMSIALAKKNPHLGACILDIAPVCGVAAGNVRRAGLSRRVRTLAGDIRDPFPTGFDVVMFCDVGAVSARHLRNAYRCLPPQGLLVLADRYLTNDGLQPLDRLAEHFAGSSFGLATRKDMVAAVKACGFRAVKARNVHQDVWCITGVKPGRRGRV
jgi:SAM-dependent methyltransferase